MDEEQRKEQLRRENAEMAAQLEQVRPPARLSLAPRGPRHCTVAGFGHPAAVLSPPFGPAAHCTAVLVLVVF